MSTLTDKSRRSIVGASYVLVGSKQIPAKGVTNTLRPVLVQSKQHGKKKEGNGQLI